MWTWLHQPHLYHIPNGEMEKNGSTIECELNLISYHFNDPQLNDTHKSIHLQLVSGPPGPYRQASSHVGVWGPRPTCPNPT